MARAAESLEQQMDRIARGVASRYARRCWWADQNDLYQQAFVIVLEVWTDYGQHGMSRDQFGGWAWTACMRQLSRYLWRESHPVSASDHDVRDLAGHGSIRVEGHCVAEGEEEQAGIVLPDLARSPEDAAALRELTAALEARLYQLCGDDDWNRAAAEVLMRSDGHHFAAGEVALAAGLPSYGVYRAIQYMKAAAKTDDVVRQLAAELNVLRRS